jgi:hypothetical protein
VVSTQSTTRYDEYVFFFFFFFLFMLVVLLVKKHALKLGCVCRSYAFNGFALASSY